MIQSNKDLAMSIEKLQEREASLKEMTLTVSDLELKKKFHLELLAIREEIQAIRNEMKLLETPTQSLLPEMFENKRAIPNSFLRGALFGIVKKGKRALVENEKIFTMSHYDIWFSGSELDQNDLEVWDTLIYLAKNKHVDNELRITLYELRKLMGYAQTQSAYDKIIERAERLKFATVKMKHEKYSYIGSLIDEVFVDRAQDGKLVIKFNIKLVNMFSDNDYTLINMDIRKEIGDNQLARWLYNFYETHKDPIPFKIDFLRHLCRSEANIYKFKSMLKDALELVKTAHVSVGRHFEYHINADNNVFIKKSKEKAVSPQKALF